MSTTQEQIALLNAEKEENINQIALLNTQITGLNQAVNDAASTIEQYNEQVAVYTGNIVSLTNDNAIIDDIIIKLLED
jgi:chromosome segregation ATPase